MPRKTFQRETEINTALDKFIDTQARITDVIVYLSPESAEQELLQMDIKISSVTIAKRYRERGIVYDKGLWKRKI